MQRVNRFWRGAVLLTAVWLLLAGCRREGATWQRIEKSGTLRIGLDPTYPPFESADGGELHGLDVDLARAVAADLGLEAEFVWFGYDGLYDALATGQVDVLISALVVLPERTRDFAYSDSYFNAGEVLVTQASATHIETMRDLAGRTLAVELGAQGHVEATQWARRVRNLSIQPYPTADEALAAVANNQADAAVIDHISGRLYLMIHPGLRISPQPVTVEPYAFAVRIGDEILLEKLNQTLENLQNTGQLEKTVQTWLGQ